MSLILDESDNGKAGKIEIATRNYGGPQEFLRISDGGYISLRDAVCMVEYILDNTDLMPGDPRCELLARIKKASLVQGYGGTGSVRINIPRFVKQ